MSAQEAEPFRGWPMIDGLHCATTALQEVHDFTTRAIAWLLTSRNLQATPFGEGMLEGQLSAYRDVLALLNQKLAGELVELLGVMEAVRDAE